MRAFLANLSVIDTRTYVQDGCLDRFFSGVQIANVTGVGENCIVIFYLILRFANKTNVPSLNHIVFLYLAVAIRKVLDVSYTVNID